MAGRSPRVGKTAATHGPVDKPGDSRPDEDARAFEEAMRDVRPLGAARTHPQGAPSAPRARPQGTPSPPRTPAARRAARLPAARVAATTAPDAVATAAVATAAVATAAVATAADEPAALDEPVEGAQTLSFRRAGVRDQQMRKLRRGLIPIEDDLDLHGLTQAAARAELERFLDRQCEIGARCVRIVHGKGYRSGARGPVLKVLVNAWLKRRTEVIAFHSARAIDGGTGAVYVLLRA